MPIKVQMAADGWVKRPFEQFPCSVYRKPKLAKVELNDKGNVRLQFEVSSGQYKGGTILKTIGVDDKRGNAANWTTLLVSFGLDEAKAKDQVKKGFDPEKLIGKSCAAIFIGEQPADPDAYADVECVPADVVDQMGKRYGFDGEPVAGASGDALDALDDDAVAKPAKRATSNGAVAKVPQTPIPESAASDGDPLGLG